MNIKLFLWAVINTGADGGKAGVTAQGICSSHVNTMKALADWCRGQWAEQGHLKDLPEDDAAVVHEYFDFWDPEEDYDIEEFVLDEGVENGAL